MALLSTLRDAASFARCAGRDSAQVTEVQLSGWTFDVQRLGWEAVASRIAREHPLLAGYMSDERAADWRFLLRALPRGDALCLGGALSPAPLALAATCRRVTVVAGAAETGLLLQRAREAGCDSVVGLEALPAGAAPFDLVSALRPAPGVLGSRLRRSAGELSRLVGPGGELYLEIDRAAALLPPPRVKRQLRHAGFGRVSCYWPKPGFRDCEMLMQLGDRRVERYYLDHQFFATTPARRALRALLLGLSSLGIFELTLPAYAVVADRGAGRDALS